jgi:hypothetical protein
VGVAAQLTTACPDTSCPPAEESSDKYLAQKETEMAIDKVCEIRRAGYQTTLPSSI